MIRKTKIKIFLGSAILVFFVFFLSSFSPLFAATDSNISELYSNPNQSSGKNPYKFKISDVVNSSLLTEVVGCTGVVNKVSTWMLKFVQSPVKQAAITAKRVEDYRKKLKDGCSIIKASAQLIGDSIPSIGGLSEGIGTGTETTEECQARINNTDDNALKEQIIQTEKMTESAYKDQCFDGIAIKLAKNQLTAMTRSAVNWVNSGYGGNPFYVQNMDNFAFNMNKSILTGGISTLRDETRAYPFGSAFSESAISVYKRTSAGNFLDSLTSDLGSFITIPDSTNGYGEIPSALERAKRANDIFANDFSSGGWNGWLALTQRDQNNPLGFTMQTAQHLAEEQAKKATSVTNELNRNGGFLDQKVCTLWQIYDNFGKPLKMPNPNYYLSGNGDFYTPEQIEPETIYVYRETKSGSGYDVCAPNGWKTLTPGGVIKEKTISYLNSPERQLELADTINDSLNALFSILISKLEGSGLSGLSDSVVTTNWTDTMNEFDTDGSSPYNNNGAYGSFNLTRDLGNTFVHDDVYKAGTWNASLNLTNINDTLIMNYSPSFGDKTSNIYWEVTTAGNAKLIENGHNVWEVGDRAFWDGSRWQNWKCGKLSGKGGRGEVKFQCPNQISPIERRGVIQVQKDYIVAAKEILKVLPNILSKMGELDYCLPGPNPAYKINSSEVESAYQTWIGSLYVGPKDADRYVWRIDDINSRTYKNFASFFDDSPNTWKNIRSNYSSMSWLLDNNPIGSFGNGGYEYNPNRSETENVKKHEKWANGIREYVSNNWFKNFYESFDKIVTTLYYKSSTNKFLEKENTSIFEPNPNYIEMAESGYSLTKDIAFYDEDIKKASEEYRDAISQAQINISKLEPIKAEVSKIILTAQARRDENLVKILNEETKRQCESLGKSCLKRIDVPEQVLDEDLGEYCAQKHTTCLAKTITLAEYKTKYAQCLDEENIQVYDPDELLNPSEYDKERCYNSFDDDLDGLVDMKDPDCSTPITSCTNGATNPPTCTTANNNTCVNNATNPPVCDSFNTGNEGSCILDITDIPPRPSRLNPTLSCVTRNNQASCEEEPYVKMTFNGMTEQKCRWRQ